MGVREGVIGGGEDRYAEVAEKAEGAEKAEDIGRHRSCFVLRINAGDTGRGV